LPVNTDITKTKKIILKYCKHKLNCTVSTMCTLVTGSICTILLSTHYAFSQEIYRPETAISDASNLCTAVGGDQNKEFTGKTSIMWEGG